MADTESAGVADLVDAGVPADQGLSALGLLMQLAGHVLGAIGVVGFAVLVAIQGARGNLTLWLFAIFASSCMRSMFQLAAGKQLLYGDGTADSGGRFNGIRRYGKFAVLQSIGIAAILAGEFHAVALGIGIGIGLLAWPVTLLVVISLPRFARFDRSLPVSEDKGFEGASIVMTIFGVTATLSTGLAVWTLAHGDQLQHGMNVFVLLGAVMLFIRAVFHATAGLSGLVKTSLDASVESAHRYASFGVVSAFCAGGVMLMALMTGGTEIAGLAFVCAATWLLLAWPLIIRRFFADRQFTDLLAGGDAPIHRRAPDAGLTWLGWLLVGFAAWDLSFLAPSFVAASDTDRAARTLLAIAGGSIDHSLWWSVGLLMLQAWAGFELVRMSPQSKLIASAYAVIAIALSLYIGWPALAELSHLPQMAITSAPDFAFFFGSLAISLIVPVSTLVLVHRKIAPSARARYRRPAR